MIWEFFRFDWRLQVRSPLLWIGAVFFAFMAFMATGSDAVQMGGAIGNVHRNAPIVIAQFLGIFTVIGMFLVAIFMAGALLRDHEMGTADLFFSTPMRKGPYLFGRFFAGLSVSLLIFVAIMLAMMIAPKMPWVDAKRVGEFSLTPYLWAMFVLVIPNLLFVGSLLCLLAATTRSMLSVYIGIIVFMTLWGLSGSLITGLNNEWAATLIDPFGMTALSRTVRYWSAAERNLNMPALSGYLLANRALWLSASVLLMAATYVLFKPLRTGTGKSWFRSNAIVAAIGNETVAQAPGRILVEPKFTGSTSWKQFLTMWRFDTLGVLKSVPFLIMLILGISNSFGAFFFIGEAFGTSVYPVTHLMLDAIKGSYSFLLILVVTFYAGELIWKERNARIGDVTDATPVSSIAVMLAKLAALITVVFSFQLVGALTAIVFQLTHGYTRIEPGLYLQGLSLEAIQYILIGVLALVLQVLTNNKFVGYLLIILWLVSQLALGAMNLEHNLYNYAQSPATPYSDMNGYGHFLTGALWFSTYWALFAGILLVLSVLYWVRGVAPTFKQRTQLARAQIKGTSGLLLGVLILAFGSSGAWIFYNTNIVNEYLASDKTLDLQAQFEREYKQYEGLPQPRISDIKVDVDLYPSQRKMEAKGHYHLVNRTNSVISNLHLSTPANVEILSISLPANALQKDDKKFGYRIYKLPTALAPGGEMELDFQLKFEAKGFTNDRGQINLVENGSFLNNGEFMPSFGYSDSGNIIDRNERRKRDLGDAPRMAKLEDETARGGHGLSEMGDWVSYEATISTEPDQIALSSGYLQKVWTVNGRRYFHYKMDKPILPFVPFVSARWQVKKDDWHGLPIEIYYDAKHAYNIDRMIASVKDSLSYYTSQYSPYQHKQVRILEFPNYQRFAQSFPNTIPYSEDIGFIADLRDSEAIDYVYYVTAHEVAHQWWAHQVVGADMQGQTMLSESLAEYSALMVMEHKYGRDKMRRFLKWDLDRYLRGRAGELVDEMPLYRVENQQYIHYRKGSLIFYRLREELGEEKLNHALALFLQQYAFKAAPYPASTDLLKLIRAEASTEQQQLITDLFEKITFYDNRVEDVTANKRADGKYEVTLHLFADKHYSDGVGNETPAVLDDWIDIGVFARDENGKESSEKPLYLKRTQLKQGDSSITVVVDGKPYDAGIDPYNKLIDRDADDNRKRINL